MIQESLFDAAVINDLEATDFDKSEYIIESYKLPAIGRSIKRAEQVAFDIETASLSPLAPLVGIGLAWEDPGLKSIYIPVGHITQTPQIPLSSVLGFLRNLFKDVLVLPFNAAYELKVMKRYGVEIPNFTDVRYYAVAHDERYSKKSLKEIGKENLGLEWGTIKEVCSRRVKEKNEKGRTISRILFDIPGTPIEKLGRYCRSDCEVTLQLYHKFVESTKYAKDIIALEKSVTPVVVEMENRGIALDIPSIEHKLQETKNRLLELEEQITNEIGKPINLNSPLQVSNLLFDELDLPTVKARSVDVNTLQELKDKHIVPSLMLEYREAEKLRSTYLEPLLERQIGGRIYTSLNQLGTESGRFSSNSPNMQNVPLDASIRKLFVASEGMVLLDYDYSQIEGRVFAHVSQDPILLEYYRNGGDIHTATSEKLGIPRKLAKTINFAIIYGAAPRKLSEIMQKEGFSYNEVEARDMIRSFWRLYKGGSKWVDKVKSELYREKQIFTVYGRRRIFPELDTSDRYLQFSIEREAANFVIQGTAADIMKFALVSCYNSLKEADFPAYLLLQVHDELLFEGTEARYEESDMIIRDKMISAAALKVPLLIEGKKGKNWAEVH